MSTRHRRWLFLSGDDASTVLDDDETQVSNSGGQFEIAPPRFGFSGDPDETEDDRSTGRS